MQRRSSWWFFSMAVPVVMALALFLAFGSPAAEATSQPLARPDGALASVQGGGPMTYTNPVSMTIPDTYTPTSGLVESCADPTIIRGQEEDVVVQWWYMYCTTDPLRGDDRDEQGDLIFHPIPMFRSDDLVNWQYMGDAEEARPSWAEPSAGLWAPEVEYFNGQYYLYFGVTDVVSGTAGSGEPTDCHFDNAIGVATSDSPLGPWTPSDTPVVEPRRGGDGCNFFWTYDPEIVVTEEGPDYIFFGSYYGGVHVRELSEDGLASLPDTGQQVAIANKFEGAEVHEFGGFYYIFLSASNCCNGPLTGYSVFAGRSMSVTGPYVDRDGVPLTEFTEDYGQGEVLSGRAGGTPVISMNGNRWVGPGHNVVFTDEGGQTWTYYHAIDRFDPYFSGTLNFTKRPALLDPIDWVDGWPEVRGGYWASDGPMPAPAAQPGEVSAYVTITQPDHEPGELLPQYSDEFSGSLGGQWSWIREPMSDTYGVVSDTFRFHTQGADLHESQNSASVLIEPVPADMDYVVETRVRLTVPPGGCCFNYTQAGLVIYANDDNFVKLVHFSLWETRQTEFAKEWANPPEGWPRYGNTIVGAPGEWTLLRIVKETDENSGEEHYTAYTRMDEEGAEWVRGGTWTHQLESLPGVQRGADGGPFIGLVSMANPDWEAYFDYVRVYTLEAGPTAVTVNTLSAQSTGVQLWALLAGSILALAAGFVIRRRTR